LLNAKNKPKGNVWSEYEVKELIRAKLRSNQMQLPHKFWRGQNGKEHAKIAIKYLIEEHLQLELNEIPQTITASTFHDAGLYRILVEFFDSSYFKAIDCVYPGVFRPWEFPKGMTGIWDGKIGRKRAHQAIKQMIKKLEITRDEIPKNINYRIFKKFNLGGLLQTLYNSSPYQAINDVYPNRFKPWEFHIKNYWRNEPLTTAHAAIKWLVKEKMKTPSRNIYLIKRKDFLEHSLGQMLKVFYENSHLKALEDVYK